jgi:hypothetical protein
MDFTNKKIALIIGHPGHELRVFRFLEVYKPRVYIITDGSGSSHRSRIDTSVKILNEAGAELSPILGYFTDREMYRILLENDFDRLTGLMDEIITDLELNNIDTIVGDAVEGYNPTHDVCRYIINTMVTILEKKNGHPYPNYEFLLDSFPTCEEAAISKKIMLDKADFSRKFKAAEDYTELVVDFKKAVTNYGTEPFKTEYLKEVTKPYSYVNWQGIPYYETFARERKDQGIYSDVISYQDHLLPIIHHLAVYSAGFLTEGELSVI